MRYLLLVFALFMAGCTSPSQGLLETKALLGAMGELERAKAVNDQVNEKGLLAFKAELTSRALGEIEQAALDEIAVASRDGLEEAEARAINKKADQLRKDALKSISDAYDAVANHEARKSFNALYQAMYAYWFAKLDKETAQYELLSKVIPEANNGVR